MASNSYGHWHYTQRKIGPISDEVRAMLAVSPLPHDKPIPKPFEIFKEFQKAVHNMLIRIKQLTLSTQEVAKKEASEAIYKSQNV